MLCRLTRIRLRGSIVRASTARGIALPPVGPGGIFVGWHHWSGLHPFDACGGIRTRLLDIRTRHSLRRGGSRHGRTLRVEGLQQLLDGCTGGELAAADVERMQRVGPCSFLFGGFASGIPQVGRVHRGIECDVGRVEVNDPRRRPAK